MQIGCDETDRLRVTGDRRIDAFGAAPVPIDLTSLPGAHGMETIAADTTIDGGSLITISGGGTVGVFSVGTGVKFTVQNLTIANGHVATGTSGGGIANVGTLTVTNSTFSGNSTSGNGGGIYSLNSYGYGSLTESVFRFSAASSPSPRRSVLPLGQLRRA